MKPTRCGGLRMGRVEPAEFRAAVVGNDQRVDRPGDGPTGGTDVANLRLLAFERRRVLAHEIFRPWDAGQAVREPALAETNAPLAALALDVPAELLRHAALRRKT